MLKFTSHGEPRIAYQYSYFIDSYNSWGRVAYAYPDSSGGNCGDRTWICEDVDSRDKDLTHGSGLSLTLDASDQPILSYGGDGKLIYAYPAGGSPGSCYLSPFNSSYWNCEVVTSAHILATSINATGAAPPILRIAYYDMVDSSIHYAYPVSPGQTGDCENPGMRCLVIDAAGSVFTPRSLSLAFDASDQPWIAYRGSSGAGVGLKIAHYKDGFLGNCGPLIGVVHTWDCDTLDEGGETLLEGASISLAFHPTGLAQVAYLENDSSSTHNLKFATQFQAKDLFLPYICISG